MNVLVQDDLTRAASFFLLAFAIATVGGIAIGDVRLGIRWGFPLGVAFGVFAYFFIVPTATDEDVAADGAAESEADTPKNE